MAVEVKDIVALLGVIGGIGGFGFGLWQYYVGQKWKRSEFAASLLEQLGSDERLATCCKILDWSSRSFPVPSAYEKVISESTFMHDWKRLGKAMRPEREGGVFNWQEMLYRDLFDYLFEYLERINHCISIGLISVDDVRSLEYWLWELARPRFGTPRAFVDFLKAYEYEGVFELMSRFGIGCEEKHR